MLPTIIHPMLAQAGKAAFDSPAYLFEIKWDGIRCLAFIEGGRVRLQSRRLIDLTLQFPELAELKALPSGTILDGELVAMKSHKPCLRAVQERAQLKNRERIRFLSQLSPVTYIAFDLLYLKGKSFLAFPLTARREALEHLVKLFPVPGIQVPEGIRYDGCRLFEQVIQLGMEGVMAKRLDGPYLAGKRSQYWLKIKPKPDPPANLNYHKNGKAISNGIR